MFSVHKALFCFKCTVSIAYVAVVLSSVHFLARHVLCIVDYVRSVAYCLLVWMMT